tara:strand:+ start:1135 stop:1932 length:798 start_codon:yes stop_codon:yes gene_type:complete
MALTNKTIASSYGDILQVDNNGSGRTANGTNIKDGLGNSTSLTLGSNKTHIKPKVNKTDTFLVESNEGTDVFKVDVVNNLVTSGSTQTYVNTQVQRFCIYSYDLPDGFHVSMMVDVGSSGIGATGATSDSGTSFGTGTDPATSLTLADNEQTSMQLLNSIFYVPVAITIDEVRVIGTGDGGNIDFHVMSYDMAGGTGSDAGDLSNGTLLAHSGSVMAVDGDRILTNTITIDSANVAADKIIIATVEQIGTSTDVSAQLLIKYHYQ